MVSMVVTTIIWYCAIVSVKLQLLYFSSLLFCNYPKYKAYIEFNYLSFFNISFRLGNNNYILSGICVSTIRKDM